MQSHMAEKLVDIILAGLHREYPNVAPMLLSVADVRPTRQRTPIFFGCYDWHSAVHSHWALVRLLNHAPARSADIRSALESSFRPEGVAAELEFLQGRPGFEMPYGIAWLLGLCAELSFHSRWSARLQPLEELASRRFSDWLSRIHHPIRSGEHSQSAFAMSMVWDWAQRRDQRQMLELLRRRGEDFYLADVSAPIDYEPSAYDFLSAILGEADFVRRIIHGAQFLGWLEGFLPNVPLQPVTPVDRADGKLAHFDGLNLSRAWMLQALAQAWPEDDRRRHEWAEAAHLHGQQGLHGISSPHYEGSHWLGSFAVYYLTGPPGHPF